MHWILLGKKGKKVRSSKIQSPKQQRNRRFCLTWKGRDAEGKQTSLSELAEHQKLTLGLEAPAGPLWGGRKTLWCYSTVPLDQSLGDTVPSSLNSGASKITSWGSKIPVATKLKYQVRPPKISKEWCSLWLRGWLLQQEAGHRLVW